MSHNLGFLGIDIAYKTEINHSLERHMALFPSNTQVLTLKMYWGIILNLCVLASLETFLLVLYYPKS
jgi:hypothetical protein